MRFLWIAIVAAFIGLAQPASAQIVPHHQRIAQLGTLPFSGAALFPYVNTPWTTLNLGGGGNFTGISIPPATGVRFARGDVFGGYIWNPNTLSWVQLFTAASMPAANFGYFPATGASQVFQGSSGVMELVGCNSSSSCAYAYFNGLIFYSGNISTSNPSTITWCNAGGFTQTADTSNASGRGPGPYMAVDPYNPAHVIVGTPSSGLFESFNANNCASSGVATWAAISTSSIPLGTSTVPAYKIAFDPTGGSQTCHTGSGTCASKAYIYTPGSTAGVYATANAGTSWALTTSGPTTVKNLKVSAATAGGGNVWAVDGTNDIIVTWSNASNQIWEVVSRNGGSSFGSPILLQNSIPLDLTFEHVMPALQGTDGIIPLAYLDATETLRFSSLRY